MIRKVYTDGNGGSIVLIGGLGAYVPESELEALKAQVERLMKAFDEFHGIAASCDGWETFPQKALDDACDAMMATPAQCLAEIKAKAGLDGFIAGCHCGYTYNVHDWDNQADEYANQLRQQAKEQK